MQTVRITLLRDRPTLGLKAGHVMQLDLSADELTTAYHEDAMGLIKVVKVKDISETKDA